MTLLPATEHNEFIIPGSLCGEDEAPTLIGCEIHPAADSWIHGLPPQPRNNNDIASGLLTAIVVVFALIAINARHCRRLFGNIGTDLWNVRRRVNAFDEHTADETRTIGLLILMLCTCEGIIMTGHISPGAMSSPMLPAAMTALMAGFYIFQLAAYCVTGYVFTDKINAAQWRKGFNASQTMLGLALFIPSLILLFYPSTESFVFIIAVILYFLARIAFICKGFKIFYHNFPSLLYFILYLCALEIIPILLVYSGAEALGSLFVN